MYISQGQACHIGYFQEQASSVSQCRDPTVDLFSLFCTSWYPGVKLKRSRQSLAVNKFESAVQLLLY